MSIEVTKKLNQKPSRHETRQSVIINGVGRHSMPIFNVRIHSLEDPTGEQIEITKVE